MGTLLLILLMTIYSANSQCNGPPMLILPNNSTGNLAFPSVNLDPMSGSWRERESYPEAVACTWILKAPPLHCFYMKILHFDTEENFDYVKLYSSESREEELFFFSGKLKEPWETIIEGETLVVDFFSDEMTSYHGFHFIYRIMPKACVGLDITISEPQLIAVPPWNLQGVLPGPKRSGFEAPKIEEISLLNQNSDRSSAPRWLEMSSYPQGINCTWKINVSPQQLLQIDVIKFATDEDDILQIWKLETSGLKPLVKLWNDEIAGNPIQSSSPLLLNFLSGLDVIGSGSGFLLNVSYISTACDPTEEVFSNNPFGLIPYPSHNLANREWLTEDAIFYGADYCRWKILAPSGYSINITLIEFDTRPEDTFKIIDGESSLMTYGGPDQLQKNIHSSGNEISITFSSDSKSKKTGFLLSYSWFLKDCQFELQSEQGEVKSPYYPDAYGDGLQCQWKLNTPPGFIAQFLIFRIRLDHGDFLQITDGDSNVILSQEFSDVGLWKFAPSKPIMVNFVSDVDKNKGHFLLKYNIYKPGNCDFSLTSCGYQPVDPLQVWDFKASERMLFIDETTLGHHLPRGYRTLLISPTIVPERNIDEGTSTHNMCLKINYMMSGQDAFSFTVAKKYVVQQSAKAFEDTKSANYVRQSAKAYEDITKSANFSQTDSVVTLLSIHGPQGRHILKEITNFTATKPFQIVISYERGYGPHYKLVIKSIEVLHEPCSFQAEDQHSSISCNFQSSFCGWRNTNKDHKNWLLRDRGITAKVNENQASLPLPKKQNKLQHQLADLISPSVNLSDLVEGGQSDLCLELTYEIHTFMADLKVIIQSIDTDDKRRLNNRRRNEIEIWTQGRVRSEQILTARIPLRTKTLPEKFKVILRSSSVKANRPNEYHSDPYSSGITVTNISLMPNVCPVLLNCDFTDGFCSWKVSSTGNTVWQIRKSHETPANNFAAINSFDAPGKKTKLTSPFVTTKKSQSLSFKYRMQMTDQCLRVGVVNIIEEEVTSRTTNPDTKLVWEQCKGKGKHWLQECVDLPASTTLFQVVFSSSTGLEGSEVWLDDVEISSNECLLTRNVVKITDNEHIVWECDSSDSLCGMTQPVIGNFDWVIQHKSKGEIRISSSYHLDHRDDSPNRFENSGEVYRNSEPKGGVPEAVSGTIHENHREVSGTVHENHREVSGNFHENHHEVSGTVHENHLEVSGTVHKNHREVSGTVHENHHEVSGTVHENHREVSGTVHENHHELSGTVHENHHEELESHSGFHCPDGRSLQPDWICDGVPDCEDLSDETGCDCGPEGCGNVEDTEIPLGPGICNEGSFRCPSGRICPPEGCSHQIGPCLPRYHLCDGIADCNEAEDETSCDGVVRENTAMDYGWQNDSPRGKRHSPGRRRRFSPEDRESTFYSAHMKDRIECSGGLLIPKSFRCDGRKDCPMDGLDEVGCNHCGINDFACPTSGICLPKSSVCDGNLSMQSCTDEYLCNSCAPGHFACDVCLPSFKICDGVWDCIEGEDETRCRGTFSDRYENDTESRSEAVHRQHPYNSQHSHQQQHSKQKEECKDNNQFECSDGRCLLMEGVCDRKRDCPRGEDEFDCLDDNKEEEHWISAKPSTGVSFHEEEFPSYLITPIFHHPEGAIGVLSFKYRLDAWLGTSNATLSVEILEANYSRTSLLPWAIWRQSGHKGTFWLKAEVLIPEIHNIRNYRIAFLIHGNGPPSRSQQIHLSNISFKMVPSSATKGLRDTICEFGNSWCGWTQSYTERGYSWVHTMASPHARRTGPITGYPDGADTGYIFSDSLHGNEGDAADLLSPPLLLPNATSSICLRFVVFLYGEHIAQLSVHAIQIGSKGGGHHPFATELFYTFGSQGLSWVPVSISINESHLENPKNPFVVIIRTTRGNGPESDIALDHISILEGQCSGKVSHNFDILTKPATSDKYLSINALKVGPSFTPYIIPADSSIGLIDETSESNLCRTISSCSNCVNSSMRDCIWCSISQCCLNELSAEGRECSANQVIWNVLAEKPKAGSSWCPGMTSGNNGQQFIAADSSIALSFAVKNIQASETEGDWTCIFEREDLGMITEKDDLTQLLYSDRKGTNHKEELLIEKQKYIFQKHQRSLIVKVRGHFKGMLFNQAEDHEETTAVGIGTINCGDGEVMITSPKSPNFVKTSVILMSPSGHLLDNTEDIHVVIYNCEGLTSDCQTCINLNHTFSCGWCSNTESCSIHVRCPTGLWQAHRNDADSYLCNVKDEFDFLKKLLGSGEHDADLGFLEEEMFGLDFGSRMKTKKKEVKNNMKKFLGDERKKMFNNDYDEFDDGQTRRKRNKKNKRGLKEKVGKGNNKIGKKGKGRGFLKVPVEPGIFLARDVWRLHTGRQYYVPVSKRTMINLGFIRQVTYGSLSKEKSRTVLMEGSWKKAAGYYIDMFEKSNQDPVTSIITTKKATFEKLLNQLQKD